MAVKVMLVDDHKIMRDGLKSSLEKEDGIVVAAEAGNGREAVRLAHNLKPDVVVMDIGMPEMNGMEATRQIHAEAPEIRVLALSTHSDKQYVMGMLKAGASGFLPKTSSITELATAIRMVAQGLVYLSPKIAELVVESAIHQETDAATDADVSILTHREKEVLQLVAEGRTTKEIALILSLSERTVETHRRQIMDKLKLRSVAELTKFAIRAGLTPLDV